MVFSPEYQQIIEITPNVRYKTSKVVWIVLGVLGLVIIALIVLAIVVAVAGATKAM
jgi:lipopolysaccharide/colanic/teichoic acid biosynthesis glycosyltransferase